MTGRGNTIPFDTKHETTMRHRRKGRKLGRNPNHQRALLRNLASALFLTERDAEGDDNKPKVKGRIITTLAKAKEVRPLVERCITIARRALPHQEAADELGTDAERNSEPGEPGAQSEQWQRVEPGRSPRSSPRGAASCGCLGDKQAVRILFDEIAPRFADRPAATPAILRLAKPRLGDAGTRAILEFVGDARPPASRRPKPTFEMEAEVKAAERQAPSARSTETSRRTPSVRAGSVRRRQKVAE